MAPLRHWIDELDRQVAKWRASGLPAPAVAVVAGSGLAVDLGPALASWNLSGLCPFPIAGIAGHELRVELLTAGVAAPVLYFRGRLHGYQGYEPGEVVYPIRLAARLGARLAVITNAAGGVDPALAPGDLVAIEDHLNLTGWSPLRGELPPEWGPPFPDLTRPYDAALSELARQCARRLGFELRGGVYAGVTGPSYETAAEVEMLRRLGAHLVGMSTVLEVIAARQMGVRCLGLSLVANSAAGAAAAPLTHDEVLAAGRAAAARVRLLLAELLAAPALLA